MSNQFHICVVSESITFTHLICILVFASWCSETNQIPTNLRKNTTEFHTSNEPFSNVPTSSTFGGTAIDFDIIIEAIQQSRSNASTISHVLALLFTTEMKYDNEEKMNRNCTHCKLDGPEDCSSGSCSISIDQVLHSLQASGKSVLLKRLVLDDTTRNTAKASSNNCSADDDVASQMDGFASGLMTTTVSDIDEVAGHHYKDVDGVNAKVENADCASDGRRKRGSDGNPVR